MRRTRPHFSVGFQQQKTKKKDEKRNPSRIAQIAHKFNKNTLNERDFNGVFSCDVHSNTKQKTSKALKRHTNMENRWKLLPNRKLINY